MQMNLGLTPCNASGFFLEVVDCRSKCFVLSVYTSPGAYSVQVMLAAGWGDSFTLGKGRVNMPGLSEGPGNLEEWRREIIQCRDRLRS